MSEDRSPFPTPTETWKNERTIRVFISSTFRDMEDEREELIKRTFPALREFCSARAVGLNEIDLRWGITDEQVSQGKLLPLLLGEIDTCRPYFIGVLGQRYGSRLNEIAEEEVTDAIVRDHPWLARYCGRSITELEILHAILLRPEWADRGFFFLKDAPHPNDETAENRADLAALKARIEGMKGDLAAVRNYSTAEELGRKVRESLEAAIDTDFPDRELSLLDRERYAHLAFAQHRSKAYRAPADTIRALDRRLEAGGAAVVTGPVGSGKSALLANWASNLPESVLVLTHFVGASSGSTNPRRAETGTGPQWSPAATGGRDHRGVPHMAGQGRAGEAPGARD